MNASLLMGILKLTYLKSFEQKWINFLFYKLYMKVKKTLFNDAWLKCTIKNSMSFRLLKIQSFFGKVNRVSLLGKNINLSWFFVIVRQLVKTTINQINCLLFRWLLLGSRQHFNVTAPYSKAHQYTPVSITITIPTM